MNSLVLRSNLEADLYVLDLGLKATFCPDSAFNLYAAAGPTLTLSDMHTYQRERVAWTPLPPPANDPGRYAANDRDSETRILLGAYAAIGLQYRISARLTVSAEFRFDVVADSPETRHAEVDLQGGSGVISCLYSF